MNQPNTIYIVSGLPRSGTSLMMHMLWAGGLPVLTDSKRPADSSNPKGYWEWEAIKKLENHPQILSSAQGKAVKIISHFLPFLPEIYSYRIIFMRRNTPDIIRSQNKMLEKRGKSPGDLSDEQLVKIYNRLLAKSKHTLQSKEIPFYEIWYEHIMKNPKAVTKDIVDFLGLPLNESAMWSVIDKNLNHSK